MEEKVSICVTGHRPQGLFGAHVPDNGYRSIEKRLAKIIKYHLHLYEKLELRSGMAQGADLIWAKVALQAKNRYPDRISLIADVPYRGHRSWIRNQQMLVIYDDFTKNADDIVYYGNEYAIRFLFDRNIGMLGSSDVVIGVWDGVLKDKGGTVHAMKHAIKTKSGYFQVNPHDDLIRWEISRPEVLKNSGHKNISLLSKDIEIAKTEYFERGFEEAAEHMETIVYYTKKNGELEVAIYGEPLHDRMNGKLKNGYIIYGLKQYVQKTPGIFFNTSFEGYIYFENP